jgi:hypothetical protein
MLVNKQASNVPFDIGMKLRIHFEKCTWKGHILRNGTENVSGERTWSRLSTLDRLGNFCFHIIK